MLETIEKLKKQEEIKIIEVEKKIIVTSPKVSLKEHSKLENELIDLKNEILLNISEIQNLKINKSDKEETITKLKNTITENTFNNKTTTNLESKDSSQDSKFQDKVKDIVDTYELTNTRYEANLLQPQIWEHQTFPRRLC